MAMTSDRRWDGWYFDGRTAGRAPVTVRVLRDGLAVLPETGGSRWWPYERIRQTQGNEPGDPVRFEHGGDPPEVLVVPDATILAAIRAAAPTRRKRFRAPGRRGVWIAISVSSALAIVLLVWTLYAWGIPAFADAVAARLPVALEEQLGEAVVDGLAPVARRCSGAEPRATLDQILGRLIAGAPPSTYQYTLTVVDDPTPNAFAAPGGYLVFTSGILRMTDRPEEVAGVMAHEIQHVIQRHGTKLLVRELSFRALVSLAAGDLGGLSTALDAARTLGGLRYRREDEAAADREAVRLLAAARIDPHAMVTLLQKMQRTPAATFEPPAYLSTHPALEDRIAALGSLAAGAVGDPIPLLPDVLWDELKQRCRQ